MKRPPDKVKLYGYVKALFFRFPFVISKGGNEEVIKTPKNLITFYGSLLCVNDFCMDFPFSPSQVIYAYFPGNYRLVMCGEYWVYQSDRGVKLFLKEGDIKKVVYKKIEILYSGRTPDGYFREVKVKFEDKELRIYVEGFML